MHKHVRKPQIRNRAEELIPSVTPPNPTDGDELLSTIEVAALIKVSTQWLNIARFNGTGPKFVKLGRRVLYRRADLREWLDSQLRQKTPNQPRKLVAAR